MTSYYYSIQDSLLGGNSGKGFFIQENIPIIGTTIGYYVGPILKAKDKNDSNFYYMAVNPSGSLLIDGSDPELNPTRFIQHACKRSKQVNVEFRAMKQSGREAQQVIHGNTGVGVVRIRSTKKLHTGDELYANYGADYYDSVLQGMCLCRAHK